MPAISQRILITDGEQRAALALARSLGRAGFEPYVCAARGKSLAGASRYTRAQAPTADPLQDAQAFTTQVGTLIRRWEIGTVIPVSEQALLPLLAARSSELSGVALPFPDLATFQKISNKKLLTEAAGAVGIAVPRQMSINAPDDLSSASWQKYPVVIKPARSVGDVGGARVKLGVSYAYSADSLAAQLRALPPSAFPVLLQERVVGPGVGVFLLTWKGEIVGQFAHRRIREKPPSGGVSVYRESIALDPALRSLSHALLERFGWNGVAMVEYKIDAATGTPYLMEVNGRFWGSLQLAIDAGVDFPVLLMRLIQGGAVQQRDYRVGVRSRWWWGDVDQLLTRLRHSAAALALPPDAPSRLASILSFLALWRPGDHNEVLRWSDPAPFLRETLDWLARR